MCSQVKSLSFMSHDRPINSLSIFLYLIFNNRLRSVQMLSVHEEFINLPMRRKCIGIYFHIPHTTPNTHTHNSILINGQQNAVD